MRGKQNHQRIMWSILYSNHWGSVATTGANDKTHIANQSKNRQNYRNLLNVFILRKFKLYEKKFLSLKLHIRCGFCVMRTHACNVCMCVVAHEIFAKQANLSERNLNGQTIQMKVPENLNQMKMNCESNLCMRIRLYSSDLPPLYLSLTLSRLYLLLDVKREDSPKKTW